MKKKKIIIIIAAILLALLIAGGLLYFFVFKDKDSKKNNDPAPVVKKEEITITFDADGGSEVEDIIVEKGKSFQLPETEKEGFVFKGWYNGSKLYTDDDTAEIEENIVLTAKWEEVKEDEKILKVTFDSKGGSSVNSLTFKCSNDAATIKNLPKSKKDSYKFLSWEDKFGKSILDGAKITCEGSETTLKLYAVWEYDGPIANPEPDKTYKCPSGYKLEGTKCTVTGTVHETCPEGTKADGSLCIKTSDNNTGTRVCTETTVAIDGKGHTWTGKGDYHFNGSYGKCAYYKWTSYTTKTQCDNARDIYHSTVWVSDLNACYAEDKMNNYETVCSSDYQWYSSSELSSKFGIHDNGKCLRKVDKTKYCDEGYTLTAGSCVKTIDATVE